VVYTARTGSVHGCVRAVYTCTRPCTRRVHGPYTAVNTACMDRVQSRVDGRVHGCIRAVCIAMYTAYAMCTCRVHEHDRVHGRVVPTSHVHDCVHGVHGHARVYMAIHRHARPYVHTARPCTRPIHGDGHGPCTRTCTLPVRTRPSARSCTRTVSIAVYGPCTTTTKQLNNRSIVTGNRNKIGIFIFL